MLQNFNHIHTCTTDTTVVWMGEEMGNDAAIHQFLLYVWYVQESQETE